MRDMLWDQFQSAVDECLLRHRSVLDVISKLAESNARVQRAFVKAVTACGCVTVRAGKQHIPPDTPLRELRRCMDSHVSGRLCEHCKEVLEAELGSYLFYLAALCNLLDVNLYDILRNEKKKLDMLGVFNCS